MINFSEKLSFKQKRISCYICLGAVNTSLACQCNPNGEQKCTVVAETCNETDIGTNLVDSLTMIKKKKKGEKAETE